MAQSHKWKEEKKKKRKKEGSQREAEEKRLGEEEISKIINVEGKTKESLSQ